MSMKQHETTLFERRRRRHEQAFFDHKNNSLLLFFEREREREREKEKESPLVRSTRRVHSRFDLSSFSLSVFVSSRRRRRRRLRRRMLERRDDAVVGYPRHSTTTRMMDTTSSPILHHQQQPSTTTTTRKKRDVSKKDDDPDDPDDSDEEEEEEEDEEEEEKQMEDAEDKTEHKASPTRPHQSRARRKKNEAIAAVTELYRLHDVDKKTNFRLTSDQLYDKMVSLVHNISTKVERSNMVQMWVPRLAGKSVVMTTHNELCKITAKKKTHDSLLAKKFSENSTAFFFNCESTNGEGLLGLPGRCYVLSRPEFTPSVTSYRPLEYVRVACAGVSARYTRRCVCQCF